MFCNLFRRWRGLFRSRVFLEFQLLNKKINTIMINQKAAADALNAVSDKLDNVTTGVTKIGGETTALLAEVDELKQAAGDNVSPELQAAIEKVSTRADSLAARVKEVDDLVADVPPATGDGSGAGEGSESAPQDNG